jgi:hypothetical protein
MIQEIETPDPANSSAHSPMWTRFGSPWKRLSWKHGLATVALCALGMSAALTNPSRAAYETYATEQASGFLLKEVCGKNLRVPEVLQQALSQGCESLSQGSNATLNRFIHQHTEHYNFGVFSLYTTELPGYQLRTIGLWHNFFIVSLG